MLGSTLLMSLREIRRNALRSFLTMLGIVIGVGAVIAMVTIGKGATQKVRNEVSALGDNLLVVTPSATRRGPARTPATPFNRQDVEAIKREVPGIKSLAPSASNGGTAVYGNENWPTTITGVENGYFEV